jgi:hypothetical protein
LRFAVILIRIGDRRSYAEADFNKNALFIDGANLHATAPSPQ